MCHAGVGLADVGSRRLFFALVGGGLMALVFYSSREGFDEAPGLAQKKKRRVAKWAKFVPTAKNPARHSDLAAVWNVRFGSLTDVAASLHEVR